MAFERNTAHKCNISEINTGRFVKKEGYESSYVITQYGNIARLNILGVVVSAETNTLILDDGTGKITIRSFEPLKKIPELGEVVTVIGKPRMYNNEKYVVPEIIKPVQNNKWIDYRKKELEQRTRIIQEVPRENPQPKQETEQEIKKEFEIKKSSQEIKSKELEDVEENIHEEAETSAEKIINYIKQKDEGKGISIAELETLNIDNFENTLKNLLAQGELYEVKAGFVKVLD